MSVYVIGCGGKAPQSYGAKDSLMSFIALSAVWRRPKIKFEIGGSFSLLFFIFGRSRAPRAPSATNQRQDAKLSVCPFCAGQVYFGRWCKLET
jgi:hypothetical protein